MVGAAVRGSLVVWLVSAAVLAAWASVALPGRLPDYGEACVLADAARLREGHLYVDPAVGAAAEGSFPSRAYVAYTPLWASVLAFVPEALRMSFGRIASAVAIYGTALAAARRGLSRRDLLVVLVACTPFSHAFAPWVWNAKPDGVALALASWALARSLAKGDVTAASAVAFATALVLKPSVAGLGVGAIFGATVASPRAGLRSCAVFAFSITTYALGLWLLSRGAFLSHLGSALGIASDAVHLFERLVHRLPFFGPALLAGGLALAAASGPGRTIGSCALGASVTFTGLGLAKVGAAANYWLEPVLGAAVICAHFGLAARERVTSSRVQLAAVGLVFAAAWTTPATLRGSRDDVAVYTETPPAVDAVRALCRPERQDVVLSEHPGVELRVDGRVLAQPLERSIAVARGRLDLATWERDATSPLVRCVVGYDPNDEMRAPWGDFPPSVLDRLTRRFPVRTRIAPFTVFSEVAP